MGWTVPRTWVASEVVTAAIMNAHVRDNLNALNGFVRKTADQSVTSSITLVNDSALSIAIPAAGTYEIKLFLLLLSSVSNAGNIRVGASFPAGTMTMGVDGLAPGSTGTSGSISRQTAAITSGVDPGIGLGVVSAQTLARIDFLFVATASGTFQFMWAQSVSSATATTVKANSYLTMKQPA